MIDSQLWPVTTALNAHGHLMIAGCALPELAAQYGTPLYLLDEATIRAACRAYQGELDRLLPGRGRVHYAGKALLNTALARIIAEEGLGLDVVSGGELYIALRAGFPAARIHLHGNAKTPDELHEALEAGIGAIMADNLDELAALAHLTTGRATVQPIMLRLNPAIQADTHAHIQTGHATSKFGLPLDALDAAVEQILDAPGLRLTGLHVHLGSQLFATDPFMHATDILLDAAARLHERYGVAIETINPGGGLGAPYLADQALPNIAAFASSIAQYLDEGCRMRGLPPLRLELEPGRSIIARAGVALYSILATKPLPEPPDAQAATRYLHVDGGMGDNIRPPLYGARYTALLANRADMPPTQHVHIAGRYCESGDVLIHNIALPHAIPGDLLAVAVCGAYTLSMASNYNQVPRPAVLLLNNGHARLIQRRETYADLVVRDIEG